MKTFLSPPEPGRGEAFYTRYASLIPDVSTAGYLAQLVSALTEWGILYGLLRSTLSPILPGSAPLMSAGAATVGVLLIELGLRRLLPFAARALIHRRWSGLDRWVSAFVLLAATVLLIASGALSFAGSRSLVEAAAPPPLLLTNAASDSLAAVELSEAMGSWKGGSEAVREQYADRLAAVQSSAAATLTELDRSLAAVDEKERRTGRKYTTQRRRITERITRTRTQRDHQLATLRTERADALADLQTDHRQRVTALRSRNDGERQRVTLHNRESRADHNSRLDQYGGGLAWFTLVCLVVLVVSVVLKELHHAGAGISQRVEPGPYAFEEAPLAAFLAAVGGRITGQIYRLVHRIERGTTDAPEPVAAPTIWKRSGHGLTYTTSNGGTARKTAGKHAARPAAMRPIGFGRNEKEADLVADQPTDLTQCVNATPPEGKGKTGNCERCGGRFERRTTWQKFCSAACRKDHHAARHGGTPFDPKYKH